MFFSSNQNVETISRLLENAKTYGNLRMESFERSLVDKLTKVITALIMGVVILLVSLIVVVFLSEAAVVALAPHVGGNLVALLIVGAFHALVLGLLYARRHAIIAIPLKMALTKIFFDERAEAPAPTAEEMEKAKQAMMDDYETLTAPPPPANNKFEQAMQTASKAWSIADGVIMGYKLYRKFGSLFGRRKRRR